MIYATLATEAEWYLIIVFKILAPHFEFFYVSLPHHQWQSIVYLSPIQQSSTNSMFIKYFVMIRQLSSKHTIYPVSIYKTYHFVTYRAQFQLFPTWLPLMMTQKFVYDFNRANYRSEFITIL